MQHYTYVIVGGGVAGTTAAETIRKKDPEGTIAIISDEPYPFYSRVMLSKPAWVLGEQPFDNVWLKKDEWYKEQSIDLFRGLSATALDTASQQLTLSDGDVLEYKKLLLATGAHNRYWTIPGADKKGVYYLRTVDDAKKIQALTTTPPQRAVFVGSACTSFEVLEILLGKGCAITEVMREKYFFAPQLSAEEVAPIEHVLEEKGVTIIREMEVEEVLGGASVEGVRLKDGRTIPCEAVFPFIGVELPLEWVRRAGIATRRGILANEFLETNAPNVYTAGDTAEYQDVVLEEVVLMGDWMSARSQGELAGKNMTGEHVRLEQVTFHTSHGFGFSLGWVGDSRMLEGRVALSVPLSGDKVQYCRLVLEQGRVLGATTLNRPDLMGLLVRLIKQKVSLVDKIQAIQAGTVELGTLLS